MANDKRNNTQLEELDDEQLQALQGGGPSSGAFKSVDGLSSKVGTSAGQSRTKPVASLSSKVTKDTGK